MNERDYKIALHIFIKIIKNPDNFDKGRALYDTEKDEAIKEWINKAFFELNKLYR